MKGKTLTLLNHIIVGFLLQHQNVYPNETHSHLQFTRDAVPHLRQHFYHQTLHVCSVISYSLQPHWLQPTSGLLGPCNFPGKYTGVGCHFLCLGIFPTEGPNLRLFHLPHGQVDSSISCMGRWSPLDPNFCQTDTGSWNDILLCLLEFLWLVKLSHLFVFIGHSSLLCEVPVDTLCPFSHWIIICQLNALDILDIYTQDIAKYFFLT